jgi:hypothetical protein
VLEQLLELRQAELVLLACVAEQLPELRQTELVPLTCASVFSPRNAPLIKYSPTSKITALRSRKTGMLRNADAGRREYKTAGGLPVEIVFVPNH